MLGGLISVVCFLILLEMIMVEIKIIIVIMIIIVVITIVAMVIMMIMAITVQLLSTLENTVSIFTLPLYCILLTMAVFPQWCVA